MKIEYSYIVRCVVDTETGETRVLETKPLNNNEITDELVGSSKAIILHEYFMTGLICIGAKNKCSMLMPINKEINVYYNGRKFNSGKPKTHTKTRGRVGRLTQLYRKHPELDGAEVNVKYDVMENTLYIDYKKE